MNDEATLIKDFVEGPLLAANMRIHDMYEASGFANRATSQRYVRTTCGSSFSVLDIQPEAGFNITEIVGEVVFPYFFDDVYTRLDPESLIEAGVRIDPQGRPEAILDVEHDSAQRHFQTLSSIKPLLKVLPRLRVEKNAFHYDAELEVQNVQHHLEREGLPLDHAIPVYDDLYYESLRELCLKVPSLYREDYWFDDQFIGHSLWAVNPSGEEHYWVAPVLSRREEHRKLRVGNLMMLHAIAQAYHPQAATSVEGKIKRINFGVDEYDYKSKFWHTRRIYKPGLRRIG